MTRPFALSPQLQLRHGRVGAEREPVLVIDDVLLDPAALAGHAKRSDFAPAYGPDGGYPGLRAPAPLDYVETVVRSLTATIGEAFDLGPVRPVRAECNFSLVTLPPAALAPAQREPHVDTADRWQFAVLHYLCDADHGGTSFFRHHATGYETLRPDRLEPYATARAAEPVDAGYVDDGGRWFERIGTVDARHNRMAVYRSCLLHSGRIPHPERLSDDPGTGRLTANIFLTLRPAP